MLMLIAEVIVLIGVVFGAYFLVSLTVKKSLPIPIYIADLCIGAGILIYLFVKRKLLSIPIVLTILILIMTGLLMIEGYFFGKWEKQNISMNLDPVWTAEPLSYKSSKFGYGSKANLTFFEPVDISGPIDATSPPIVRKYLKIAPDGIRLEVTEDLNEADEFTIEYVSYKNRPSQMIGVNFLADGKFVDKNMKMVPLSQITEKDRASILGKYPGHQIMSDSPVFFCFDGFLLMRMKIGEDGFMIPEDFKQTFAYVETFTDIKSGDKSKPVINYQDYEMLQIARKNQTNAIIGGVASAIVLLVVSMLLYTKFANVYTLRYSTSQPVNLESKKAATSPIKGKN